MQGKGAEGVKSFVESKGLVQVSDAAEIEAMIDTVLAANQKQLEQYRAGKTKLQGHFVGYAVASGNASCSQSQRQCKFARHWLSNPAFIWQVRSTHAIGVLYCVCRQVMKASKGRVNPAVMNKILMQKLKGS